MTDGLYPSEGISHVEPKITASRHDKISFSLAALAVGESIFVPLDEASNSAINAAVTTAKRRIEKTGVQVSFSYRRAEKDGVVGWRIWRLEPANILAGA